MAPFLIIYKYYLPFVQCKSQSQVTKQKKEAGNFAFASAML